MFTLAENKKIGMYLNNKILSKYKNKRQFCIAYLEHENIPVNDDEIRKKQLKMKDILKGNKGTQLYDLPVFCDLLEVSCEEILSAGKCFTQNSNRVTNYSIAFSSDENEWKNYIEREDKLVLNEDEYCKTIIDYAVEFKNYKLIKFLMDNNYIWFDGGNKKDYVTTFGASTSIKRRQPGYVDYGLQDKLNHDKLRQQVITLAIENHDYDVFDKMRARELPEMYLYNSFGYNAPMGDEFTVDYDLIQEIANSDNNIINYFTDEFVITQEYGKRTEEHRHVFLFYSQLLDCLIKNKHNFVEVALDKAISWNKKVYDNLKSIFNKIITESDNDNYLSVYNYRMLSDSIRFNEERKLISYFSTENSELSCTNIICVSATSKDVKIQHLIDKLNDLYDKIVNIQDEYQ